MKKNKSVMDLVEEWQLGTQISDVNVISELCDRVIHTHTTEVARYQRSGNKRLIGFLVSRVLSLCEGRANPALTHKMLLSKLQVQPKE